MTLRAVSIGLLALCSTAVIAEQAGGPPRLPPGMAPGYLALDAVPDSAALLPPAPAKGSGTDARDKAAAKAALAAHSTPRWTFAASDADLFSPKATGALSCAAGFEISPQTTPKLDKLLRRTIIDFGFATYRAKQKFNRDRPFETNKRPICTPDQDAMLRHAVQRFLMAGNPGFRQLVIGHRRLGHEFQPAFGNGIGGVKQILRPDGDMLDAFAIVAFQIFHDLPGLVADHGMARMTALQPPPAPQVDHRNGCAHCILHQRHRCAIFCPRGFRGLAFYG